MSDENNSGRRPLSVADFSGFFEELWGYSPYAWQQQMVDWIVAHERFPDVVPVMTGGGKTAMLDIFVFVLALDAQRSIEHRWVPRRAVLVVDRRVVVDQNGFRGAKIASKIATLETPVVSKVRARLSSLSDSQRTEFVPRRPVESAVLRGGIARDETWAERPDVPSLLSSTVDQVGSRLLFSGYGLGKGQRPMHAGLLGNDTLVLLDEVHLSVPFAQTLQSLVRLRGATRADRFHVCELSATPRSSDGLRFPDAEIVENDPSLERLRGARKFLTLAPPLPAKGGGGATQMAKALHAELVKQLGEAPMLAAIMVNQVDTAVATWKELNSHGFDVRLITGRMRGLDRDKALQSMVGEREEVALDVVLRDRSARSGMTKHLIVVSTQCLEAGADYDFDLLVTECASVDSLIQRVGRLDRRGERGSSSLSVVVREADMSGDTHPIYGLALRNTWRALQEYSDTSAGPLDIGDAFVDLRDREELKVRPHNAPVLLQTHLRLLAQTNPVPDAAPDPALFLHGLGFSTPQISVMWRREVSPAVVAAVQMARGEATENLEGSLTEWLRATRPTDGETVTIPRYALSALFDSKSRGPAILDVDAVVDAEEQRDWHAVISWDGEAARIVAVSDVPAGVTIVLPAHVGGLGAHGTWDPHSSSAVVDVADEAVLGAPRSNKFMRLIDSDEGASLRRRLADADVVSAADIEARFLDELLLVMPSGTERSSMSLREVPLVPGSSDGMFVVQYSLERTDLADIDNEADESEHPSFTGSCALLKDHLQGVGEWCRHFVGHLEADEGLKNDVVLAGRLHDLGKADPRFQAWLNGGAPVGGELLAKSKPGRQARADRNRARTLAGYPKGMRHEFLSLALVESCDELLAQATDPELVKHLVSSHHGYCRPQAKATRDRSSIVVTVNSEELLPEFSDVASSETALSYAHVGSGIVDRFARLNERYGWYRLAWLETLLRLADHRRSHQESTEPALSHQKKELTRV